MLRRRAGVLAAALVLLLVAGCGGDDDGGSKDAEAILREYALTSRDLVDGWPPPQAAPEIARLSIDAQRPRVDGVARLAERAQKLADDSKDEEAAAYAALATAMTGTHADLQRKLGVIGRDEYWALDFYCSGLDETLAAARQQAVAVDGVIAQLEVDAPPDVLSRDGGALATAARCRDAVNEAAGPLASPAGGFAEGLDERAEHVGRRTRSCRRRCRPSTPARPSSSRGATHCARSSPTTSSSSTPRAPSTPPPARARRSPPRRSGRRTGRRWTRR